MDPAGNESDRVRVIHGEWTATTGGFSPHSLDGLSRFVRRVVDPTAVDIGDAAASPDGLTETPGSAKP